MSAVGFFEDEARRARQRRRRARRRATPTTADTRTWRDRLRAASFRGVPFFVDEATGAAGRRYQHHEFPGREKPWAEDLGRQQRRWQVTGYVLGAGYMATRDQLISACERAGAGKLVHPYLGELLVACTGITYRERDEDGGICRFELGFVEPGTRGAPDATRAAGAALRGAAFGMAGAALDAFVGNTFRVEGFPDFVAASAKADLVRLAHLLEGLRGPTLLAPDAAYLEAQARMRALLLLAPERVTPTVVAETVLAAIAAFAVAVPVAVAFDGLDVLSRVRFEHPQPHSLPHLTAARAQEQENARSVTALVHQAAALALAGPLADIPLAVYEDLVETRTRVVALCDRVEETATDACFEALAVLRAQCIATLNVRGATARPLRRYAVGRRKTSLALAQRLYRDPRRADELVARTGAPHPALLPMTGLVAAC
jgi:prophage DNA circulation protein